MSNDSSQVTKRLLSPSPSNMNKAVIENEMENNENKTEADLRLHDAVYDPDNIEEIEDLLAENENLVFERDDEGRTPLHTLTIAGDDQAPEIVKLLLGVTESENGQVKGVNRVGVLHLGDDKGFTPLHYAARNWQPALVAALLKYGSKAFLQDGKGNTPLHFATEGNTDNALECAKAILKYDKDGSLINSKNGDELTPLHMAIKNEAVDMVDLLLQKEYKLNLSAQDKLGQTVLHYICLQPGETEKSSKMAKAIVKCCNQSMLNQPDSKGITPLHVAAIERLPQIVKILVQDERTDVLRIDERNRTALHYAAENGLYPKGHQCVEVLLTRKFTESNDLIRYLYQMKDDKENTSFMYACLNCPVETMQKYLSIIPEPRFWMTESSMILIYKESPRAIKALMDRAFSEQKKSKDAHHDAISIDFGPITGYTDPVIKLPQQETKYLKQALWWDYETQKEILMHPLVQLYVFKKCQKLREIIYGWIFWQFLWLIAYTLLAVSLYSTGIDSKVVIAIASSVMVIYMIISLVNEIFEMFAIGFAYFISVTNLIQLVQIVLGVLAIAPVIFGYVTPGAVNKHAAATGVLLAYILSMRDIGKMHEMIGLVVEVLKQVVIQIVKVLLCCSPLLIGFTLAFIILFDNDESLNTAFPGPLVKVLVMMTGEFEYNDTFKGDEDGVPSTSYRAAKLVFFLSFLIAVPVAFFNLLTGFALDKVMELRERAKVGRIAKQLEHIHFIESILLSLSFLKKLCLPWLRRRNVTTAVINGELQFSAMIQEVTKKKFERKPLKGRRMDDVVKCIRRFFGTQLPAEVRKEIFDLASAASNGDKTLTCICNCTCTKCKS